MRFAFPGATIVTSNKVWSLWAATSNNIGAIVEVNRAITDIANSIFFEVFIVFSPCLFLWLSLFSCEPILAFANLEHSFFS
jgi:hypothetical protein